MGIAGVAFFAAKLVSASLASIFFWHSLAQVERFWRDSVLSPHTTLSVGLTVGFGGCLGLLASALHRGRRTIIACGALSSAALVPLLVLLSAMVRGHAWEGWLAFSAMGFIAIVLTFPGAIAPALAAGLALERTTRFTATERPATPVRPTRGRPFHASTWAGLTVGVVAISFVCLEGHLPRRPNSRVERLMMQLAGRRCDELRQRSELLWGTSEWTDICQDQAAVQLGEMGPHARAAVPALILRLLATSDVDTGDGISPVQSSIARALGEIGDTRAVEPLRKILRRPDQPGRPIARFAAQEAISTLAARIAGPDVDDKRAHSNP